MFPTLTKSTQALLFYVLTVALALICTAFPSLLVLYMFTPALAVLVMMLVITRDGYHRAGWSALGLTRLDLRSWPAAILIPVVVVGAGFAILWATGLVQTVMPFAEVKWLNTALYYLYLVVLNTLVFSLGEEIGWRGYLLPRLVESFGKVKAYLLVGLGWAFWHYPLILTGQYQSEGNRLVVLLLFTATVLALSVVIGELYWRRRSVWVASLFHSSHNAIWGLFASFSVSSALLTYLGGESGLIPLALYAAVAVWLLTHQPSASQDYETQLSASVHVTEG